MTAISITLNGHAIDTEVEGRTSLAPDFSRGVLRCCI